MSFDSEVVDLTPEQLDAKMAEAGLAPMIPGEAPPERSAEDGPNLPTSMADDWDVEEPEIVPTLVSLLGATHGLFYPGKSHQLAGPGGEGKTWLVDAAIQAIVDELRKPGAIVVFLDWEDVRGTFKSRLQALGVDRDDAKRIFYWNCNGLNLMKHTPEGKAWLAWCDVWKPTFVAIDSVSQACADAKVDDEKGPEFQVWNNSVIKPLTAREITTLRLDHTGNADSMTGKLPTRVRGTSVKMQNVSGWSALFVPGESWSKHKSGWARVQNDKDRHGTWVKGETMCIMEVDVKDEGRTVRVKFRAPDSSDDTAPKSGAFDPANLEKVYKVIAASPGIGVRDLRAAVPLQGAVVDHCVARLRTLGFVDVSPVGKKMAHTVLKAWDADSITEPSYGTDVKGTTMPGPGF